MDRQRASGLLERLACTKHGGFDLEDVLCGFDDQQVRATGDQSLRLLGEDLD